MASSVRVTVEHVIGALGRQFPLPFEKDTNKLQQGFPHELMKAATILFNVHVCRHGSQSSLRFRCFPPSVEEWLSGEPLSRCQDPEGLVPHQPELEEDDDDV